MFRSSFDALLDRALADLLPALDRLLIAATRARRTGYRSGPTQHRPGAPAFGVGVERRDVLRRYTSAALR